MTIININSDGTIPGPSATCQQITQQGCTAKDTGCVTTAMNGCMVTATTDVTFAMDGASMSGLETLSIACPDGSSCAGTFQVSGQRQ